MTDYLSSRVSEQINSMSNEELQKYIGRLENELRSPLEKSKLGLPAVGAITSAVTTLILRMAGAEEPAFYSFLIT